MEHRKVDQFIKKLKVWQDEVVQLREILQSTKLAEDFKWGYPCYTYNKNNIVIIQPFKSYLGLMFFKGMLLKDSKKLLIANGPHSQYTKRFEFESVAEIKKLTSVIKAYAKEAIAIEESGQKVEVKKSSIKMPEELKKAFVKNAKLKKAFNELTPGRQRGYLFFFASAKQPATREARIQKCVPKILQGKGLND
ncbi:MAG: YdeI/OmpD-associated family protein [Bdellovibrionota bacterium]